jgi:hypothetical protein
MSYRRGDIARLFHAIIDLVNRNMPIADMATTGMDDPRVGTGGVAEG